MILPAHWRAPAHDPASAIRADGLTLYGVIIPSADATIGLPARWRAYAADPHLIVPYPDLRGSEHAWAGVAGIPLADAIAHADTAWPYLPVVTDDQPALALIRAPTDTGLANTLHRFALFGAPSTYVGAGTGRSYSVCVPVTGWGSVVVVGAAPAVRTITLAGIEMPLLPSPLRAVNGIPRTTDAIGIRTTQPRLLHCGQMAGINIDNTAKTPEIVTAWLEVLAIDTAAFQAIMEQQLLASAGTPRG